MYGNNKKKQFDNGGPIGFGSLPGISMNLIPNQGIGFGMQNAGSILPQSNISSTPYSMGAVNSGGFLSSLGNLASGSLGSMVMPGIGAALQGFGAYRQAKNQQRALDSAIGVARNIPSMIGDMYSPAMQRAQQTADQYNPYTGIMSRNLQRTIGSGLTQNIGATDPSMRKLFTRNALSQAERTASEAVPMFAQQQAQAQNILSGLELNKGQALIGAQENLAELEAARKGIDPFGQALGSIGGSLLGFGQAGGKAQAGSVADLKKVSKELQKASKMHLGQSKRVAKHASMMNEKSDGGYIKGPHHGAGGVDFGNNIEVQGGEFHLKGKKGQADFIVNANAYNANPSFYDSGQAEMMYQQNPSIIESLNKKDNEVTMMNALFGNKHSGADMQMKLQPGGKRPGLWANIHAKRKRIEEGSPEKMREPGSKGAPTAKAFRDSQAQGGGMAEGNLLNKIIKQTYGM